MSLAVAAVSGDTPLHLAVWNNHVAIVRELLAAGAEKDIKQGTGLGLGGLFNLFMKEPSKTM